MAERVRATDGMGGAGGLSFDLEGGAVRGVRFDGVEALRMLDYPIRDADWRTLAVVETGLERDAAGGVRRRFRTEDGAFSGVFEVDVTAGADAAALDARLVLTAEREALVNRAGFVLLHPIAGVAGAAVEVAHADGSRESLRFPALISPGQPVFDIVGLRHQLGPVAVDIAMEGEVFEMEDQRNWTDASFKTYCRPLSRPRPYRLDAGETVRQRVVVTLTRASAGYASGSEFEEPVFAQAPAILLAHEPGLGGAAPAATARLGIAGLLLRVDAADPVVDTGPMRVPVTLEVVTGTDVAGDLARARAACAAAGLLPARVVALPRTYLASHQPDGPWPQGPTPMDAAAAARMAFPEAEIGGGALTNFTEFNRCRPDPGRIDFATFGTTAIVHAADDRSVLETLEALGDVLRSARTLSADRPMRLGLVSIGMRSNPYGAAVAANPQRARVPMAMEDPRQSEPFAAAFAVAAAAAATRGGVASFAPAMAAGPLGLGDEAGLWPIYHAVAALAALGGAEVVVAGGPAAGLVTIAGRGTRGVRGVAANLGPGPATVTAPDGAAVLLLDATAVGDPDWIDRPAAARTADLAPLQVAAFKDLAA